MKPCQCGKESELHGDLTYGPFVGCKNPSCWSGPRCNTLEEAEAARDLLMGEKAVRKPVACFPMKNSMVICNDGTIWEDVGISWIQLPPIPGTEADQ